jgi:hypothetical protein
VHRFPDGLITLSVSLRQYLIEKTGESEFTVTVPLTFVTHYKTTKNKTKQKNKTKKNKT